MSAEMNNGNLMINSTDEASKNNFKDIQGYKKINAEEYKLIENCYMDGKVAFGAFPSDGLWVVHTHGYGSRSTSRLMDIKKFKELPPQYPVAELALRADDISRAISNFIDKKEKNLMELGTCRYNIHELTEHIITHIINQEFGGGSKKVIIEKKCIKIEK